MIAGSACYTTAGGQKDLKLALRMQAKPGAATKPQRRNLWERRAVGINAGLHKAEYEGTNALSSAAAVGGRLRRMVSSRAYCLHLMSMDRLAVSIVVSDDLLMMS